MYASVLAHADLLLLGTDVADSNQFLPVTEAKVIDLRKDFVVTRAIEETASRQ